MLKSVVPNGNTQVQQRPNASSNTNVNNAGSSTPAIAKRLPPLPTSQYSAPTPIQQPRRNNKPSRPAVTISQVAQVFEFY